MGEPIVRTICPDCRGSGIVVVERAAVMRDDRQIHRADEQQTCKTCKGEGRLLGIVPPI